MCDFFWLSPADQGDLSDVVRASLQQLPATTTSPAAAACSHESLGAGHDNLLLVQEVNSRGHYNHDEHQLVRGDGMGVMVSAGDSDPLLLQDSATCAQPEPLQTEGLFRHVILSPPSQSQLLGSAGVVEGECDVVAPEMDLDMAMDDAHPHHAPAIKRRFVQSFPIP